jgi:ATP-dependent Clp protease ATP-binding subunit ClpC
MTDDIQKLISGLRLGEYDDSEDKINLLTAALIENKAEALFLLSLLRAPQVSLCLAAIGATRGRKEPSILDEVVRLASSPSDDVRARVAWMLALRSDPAAIAALKDLAKDSVWYVRSAVLQATAGVPEFRTIQEICLRDPEFAVRNEAVRALDRQPTPMVVGPLALLVQTEENASIGRSAAEIIEKRLTDFPTEAAEQLPENITQLSKIEARLKQYGVAPFPKFMAAIVAQTTVKVDPEALARFGTYLTPLARSGKLPRPHHVEEGCEAILKLLRHTPPRSIVLVGPAGVGKSVLVHELVYRLAEPENGGWHVLRMSPSDFMIGTKYIGEWETKVSELVEAIRKPRRVLLYVPNLSDLSTAGMHSKSDSNIATALAPYLEDGSVVILGETAPEEYERGLGKIPSLRRLFDQVLLQEASIERTLKILHAIRDEERSQVSDEVLGQLLEVSTQFLSHICRPGNAVELLRAVIKSPTEPGRSISFRDILNSVSQSTGIPADLLDDSVPLKHREVQHYFESRVIGQPKAVEAIVDLVTLIKAGVTDPQRPFGVFLFVGPTGVGKTELARALADYIFGDASRLKRFDMSEFANYDGFTRLIGNANEGGLLTDAVRQHPFSVVLLDEIEKSHTNVFDLCLQIFDAGRLTDGRGRTIDFRRTIIVLTSNVGATATGLVGFGAGETTQNSHSDVERLPRELSRFFRPEFLNRLDRIIQFQPLSLEVAEQIAKREIQSVLQRSGIRRRELAVDVDSSVLSRILREGYSPHFGARPLKRTVERLLLLPLARAIAGGSLGERTVLRLSEQAGRVQATIASSPKSKPADDGVSDRSRIPHSQRLENVRMRYAAIDGSVRALTARKSELLAQTRDPSFFGDAHLRASVLNDIYNLDQFLNLNEEIGRALKSIHDRSQITSPRTGEAGQREKLAAVERDVEYLDLVAGCQDARDLGDAVLAVTLIDRTGQNQEAVQKLVAMYQGLAARRRIAAEVLGENYDASHDSAYLLVSGLGAYGLLKEELGLHQVNRRYKHKSARSDRELMGEDREILRVNVFSAVNEPSRQFQQRVKIRTSPLKPPRERLLRADFSVSFLHEPSLRSLELWAAGPRETAIARGLMILAAQLEGPQVSDDTTGVIREYHLGIGARVRDNRTGRETTRVKQVLKGEVESLLARLANAKGTAG